MLVSFLAPLLAERHCPPAQYFLKHSEFSFSGKSFWMVSIGAHMLSIRLLVFRGNVVFFKSGILKWGGGGLLQKARRVSHQ